MFIFHNTLDIVPGGKSMGSLSEIKTILLRKVSGDIEEFARDIEAHFGDEIKNSKLSEHLVVELYRIFAASKYGKSKYA